ELTLLALLSGGSTHAYDLVQRIRDMEVRQWARVPESTVYVVLRRMEERGWVTGISESGDRGRSRTRYDLTSRGRARLADLVRSGLEEPAPMYSDLLVAGVFASGLGLRHPLRAAARRAEERAARLRALLDQERLSEHGGVILRFYAGLAALHAEALAALGELEPRPTREGVAVTRGEGAGPDGRSEGGRLDV
ncbi:MAG: PadR family transcriptional regulator, partial [Gemmatimonadota bacterium]